MVALWLFDALSPYSLQPVSICPVLSIMRTVGICVNISEITEAVCSTAEVRGFCPVEYWGFFNVYSVVSYSILSVWYFTHLFPSSIF